jgi:mannitol/fructose-specific phosphotransferase system IIA component (Ntr-type)
VIRLTRWLKPPQVRLELSTRTPAETPEGWSRERFAWSVKEPVLGELADLLETTGRVVNRSKLLTDLINRERKSSTAIGEGIAIPHVRTMQSREFAICFARSTPGVEFDAIDGAPVHFFFAVVAPPYDDKLYLEVYRSIGELFRRGGTREALLAAKSEHEVIRIIAGLGE